MKASQRLPGGFGFKSAGMQKPAAAAAEESNTEKGTGMKK